MRSRDGARWRRAGLGGLLAGLLAGLVAALVAGLPVVRSAHGPAPTTAADPSPAVSASLTTPASTPSVSSGPSASSRAGGTAPTSPAPAAPAPPTSSAPVASGGRTSALSPRSAAPLSAWELVHRRLVVTVAGRSAFRVGEEAAARNLREFGVRTPAQVVRTFHPGGVVLFSDNVASVDQVTRLTAGLVATARDEGYRLLVMTDQEGGSVSRLPGTVAESQPSAASYGGDATAARRDARRVGAAMLGMGVSVDLAPVADVNTVGDAGVIGDRSFGSTPDVVSRMVHAQVEGYHLGGVATTIKHWPGHGSTRVDSHQALPTLTLPPRRWRRVHVPPFVAGIDAGTDLVMVGHLAYPALDPSGLPATLSPALNRRWLRDRLGFTGVVVTDSLERGALRGFGGSGALAVKAFRAGSDLLLMPADPRAAARGLLDAVRSGKVARTALVRSESRVDRLRDRLGPSGRVARPPVR